MAKKEHTKDDGHHAARLNIQRLCTRHECQIFTAMVEGIRIEAVSKPNANDADRKWGRVKTHACHILGE